MAYFARMLAWVYITILYRVRIYGKENIPKTGGAIFCMNHNGWLDMLFVGCKIRRYVHYMAKEELFKNPLSAFLMRQLRVFPVKRGRVDISAMKTAIDVVGKGHILGLFPEGTRLRQRTIETLDSIKAGVAFIAMKSGAPVIPIAIQGDLKKKFSDIKVTVGEPFYIKTDSEKRYTSDELAGLSRDAMLRVYKLLGVE